MMIKLDFFHLKTRSIVACFAFSSIAIFAYLFYKPLFFPQFFNLEAELFYASQGVGRLGFYLGAMELITNSNSPAGVGAAVYEMSKVTGIEYKENNVHNIYLQIFLDLGVFGILTFFGFALGLFNISRKISANFLPASAVLIYLFVGLIQFTGYDSVAWVFIGMTLGYLALQRSQNTYLTAGKIVS